MRSKAIVGSAGSSARTSARYASREPHAAREPRALLRAPRRAEFGFELRDLRGHLPDVILDALHALLRHRLTGDLVRDDLGARIRLRIDLVAVPVVPVEVRVDHVAHRLARDVAQALHDDAGGRRLRVGVDDDHAVVRLDDRRVAVHLVGRRGDRHVHAVRHLSGTRTGRRPRPDPRARNSPSVPRLL